MHIDDGDRGQYNGDNGQYVHIDDGDRGQYRGDESGRYQPQGGGEDRGQYRPDQHAAGTGNANGHFVRPGGNGAGHGSGNGAGQGNGFVVPSRPTNNGDSYNGKYRIIRFDKDQDEDGYHYL